MAREIMIDLASYQANLTANDYRAIGATKAIVKVTESTNYVNPYIQSEVNNAAAGGVNGFAFYHFGRFTNDAGAKAEAEFFIANAKAKANVKPGTLLVLDAEINNMPTSSVIVFLDTLRNAGYHTGFYTYKYLLPKFDLEAIHQHCDFFWLAAYVLANGKADGKEPNFNYFPSANYVDAWQYTDNLLGYKVDGSITLTDNALALFNPTEVKQPEQPAQPANKPAETVWKDALGDEWHAENGTFTSTTALHLRWGAKVTATSIAVLPSGSLIKYDAWSRHNGFVWLRQPRGNGQYGYLVCRNANTGEPYGTFK
jgi:GH25 family lysozyme M1 (1,4-beta-N-acetylmuramidase)